MQAGVAAALEPREPDGQFRGRSWCNPVFVDGRMVIEDGGITTLDEEHLVAGYQATGEAVVARSGFPDQVESPTT